MKSIKLILCSFLLLVCFSYAGVVQAATVGTTTSPASQVIAYYNTDEGDSDLQITNTSFASPVWVHVQILDPNCNELDFFRFLTEGDTENIDIGDENGFSSTEGIVIVNAVADNNDFTPIEFPHIIGSMTIAEGNEAYYTNAMGRQLVGGVFETLTPTDVYSPFWQSTFNEDQDIVLAAWTDNYAGGYLATSGSASTQGGDDPVGLFIVDDMEGRDSCGNLSFECLYVGAVNTFFGSDFDTDPEEDGTNELCSFNNDPRGLAELLNLNISQNLIALTAGEHTAGYSGFDYSIAIGPAEAPPVGCSDDPCSKGDACTDECIAESCVDLDDCVDDSICDGVSIVSGSLCVDGVNQETNCTDVVEDVPVDNDGDNNANCADSDCANDAACQDNGNGGEGGGGGGGCSVATAATGLGSMANALVLLIPAFGIGARRIRQRLNK